MTEMEIKAGQALAELRRNKEKPTELRWYNDPGHGWLAVTVRDLLDSGVAGDISRYSYHDPQTAMVYLEEDSDATKYLVTFGITMQYAASIAIETTEPTKNSFVRSLPSYTPEAIGL